MAKRRNFTDQFKAKVALEALRGDKTVQEIAAKHQLHPNQVSTWKRQAIDGMADLFSGGKQSGPTEAVGGTLANVVERVRAQGVDLPDGFLDDIYARMFERLARDVTAVEGITQVLEALGRASIPFCIASNGPMEKMDVTLGKTGLMTRFSPHIFSAHVIGLDKAKPHPGLFLYAAQTMGFAPAEAVVIEDSVAGVTAAKAARMRCFGYAADSPAEALAALDAQVFFDMADLPDLLGI